MRIGVSSNSRIANIYQDPKEFNIDSRGELSRAGLRNIHNIPAAHVHSVRSEPPQRRTFVDSAGMHDNSSFTNLK